MLTAMGFSEQHAAGALKATGNDMERAADWLFSHMDDLDGAVAALEGEGGAGGGDASTNASLEDGNGRYRLRGFVSHIGGNTGSGHYVAHVRKHLPGAAPGDHERWVIFNDSSVALSHHPPMEHGYLYLYERDM